MKNVAGEAVRRYAYKTGRNGISSSYSANPFQLDEWSSHWWLKYYTDVRFEIFLDSGTREYLNRNEFKDFLNSGNTVYSLTKIFHRGNKFGKMTKKKKKKKREKGVAERRGREACKSAKEKSVDE